MTSAISRMFDIFTRSMYDSSPTHRVQPVARVESLEGDNRRQVKQDKVVFYNTDPRTGEVSPRSIVGNGVSEEMFRQAEEMGHVLPVISGTSYDSKGKVSEPARTIDLKFDADHTRALSDVYKGSYQLLDRVA